MNAYAAGFVVACFVGMFVAGLISDWLNRRKDRIRAARRVEATRLSLAYLTDPVEVERVRQVVAAETAKARRAEPVRAQGLPVRATRGADHMNSPTPIYDQLYVETVLRDLFADLHETWEDDQ